MKNFTVFLLASSAVFLIFSQDANQTSVATDPTGLGSSQMLQILDDHTDRLTRIEEALQEVRSHQGDQITEDARESIKAGAAQVEEILSSYHGQGYYIPGRRGNRTHMIKHLISHGMSPDGLESYSYFELEKVHGAIHTKHASTTCIDELCQTPG